MKDLSIIKFAYFYIPSDVKIRIIKSFKIVFEGTKDDLYIHAADILEKTIDTISADDGVICINCK